MRSHFSMGGGSVAEVVKTTESNDAEGRALVIDGVVDYWSGPRFSAMLRRSGIRHERVIKVIGNTSAIVEFGSLEDKRFASDYLVDCQLANNTLKVRPYIDYDPPTMPYATQSEIKSLSDLKVPSIMDRIYPFDGVSVSDRIRHKKKVAIDSMADILDEKITLELVPAEEEPVQHYSVELLVGYNREGGIGIGFNSASKMNAVVETITREYHLPEQIVTIAESFQKFVEESPFPPFDPNSNTGKWRTLVVRMTTTGEIMIIVATFGGLPLFEVKRMISCFDPNVHSVYWVKADRDLYTSESPNRVIRGAQLVTEVVDGINVSIHPFSYVPPNLGAYINSLHYIREKCGINENTVLVDLSCGIGLSPLLYGSYVKRAVGIDANEPLINIAKSNAESSNRKNVLYVHGKPETILGDLANNVSASDKIVCIIDTANSGAHVAELKAIRLTPRVRTFAFTSDSSYSFAYDVQRLICLEDDTLGEPFKLVDMRLYEYSPLVNGVKVTGVFMR